MKIDIFLENKNSVFHPFSVTTLNPELASYIYDECIGKKKNTPIQIEITSNDKLTEEDKELIEALIKNHFIHEIEEEKIKDKKSIILYIILCFIGCLFIFLALLTDKVFLSEIFNILGWLSIWELVYDILFVESKDNIKMYRYKEIVKSEIIF